MITNTNETDAPTNQILGDTAGPAAPTNKFGYAQETLTELFKYHPPTTQGQIETYDKLRSMGLNLAMLILTSVPTSRDQTLAITKLREALMFANSAIANDGLY